MEKNKNRKPDIKAVALVRLYENGGEIVSVGFPEIEPEMERLEEELGAITVDSYESKKKADALTTRIYALHSLWEMGEDAFTRAQNARYIGVPEAAIHDGVGERLIEEAKKSDVFLEKGKAVLVYAVDLYYDGEVSYDASYIDYEAKEIDIYEAWKFLDLYQEGRVLYPDFEDQNIPMRQEKKKRGYHITNVFVDNEQAEVVYEAEPVGGGAKRWIYDCNIDMETSKFFAFAKSSPLQDYEEEKGERE